MTDIWQHRALTDSSNILITGCTGMIGGELLKKLLNEKERRGQIWTLVRAQSDAHALERIENRLLKSTNSNGKKNHSALRAVKGDVTKSDWGLSKKQLKEILPSLDLVIHCASDTSFLSSESVLECNTASIKNLISMLSNLESTPLVVYISTAANIGKVSSTVVKEETNREPQDNHHNLYTQSKAACELMLQEAGIRSLILRPSIVLSAGINDSLFAGSILWMMPLLCYFKALPLNKGSRLDIVPVEFVVESILSLLKKNSLKFSTYHISAGESDCITIEESFRLTDSFYNRPSIEFVHPESWDSKTHKKYVSSKKQRELYHRIKYYFPFLNMDVVYDNTRLKEELGELKIPPLAKYVNGLLSQITEEAALEESVKP